jgi:hypothetical protein
MEQKGLVVDIARAAQGCLDIPAIWQSKPSEALVPTPSLPSGGLAEVVLAWLNEAAPAEMQVYGQVVSSALQAQLAPHDLYEATVLDRLNQHLSCLMHALGLGRPSTPLSASALSQVCGQTLRDWGAKSS